MEHEARLVALRMLAEQSDGRLNSSLLRDESGRALGDQPHPRMAARANALSRRPRRGALDRSGHGADRRNHPARARPRRAAHRARRRQAALAAGGPEWRAQTRWPRPAVVARYRVPTRRKTISFGRWASSTSAADPGRDPLRPQRRGWRQKMRADLEERLQPPRDARRRGGEPARRTARLCSRAWRRSSPPSGWTKPTSSSAS